MGIADLVILMSRRMIHENVVAAMRRLMLIGGGTLHGLLPERDFVLVDYS